MESPSTTTLCPICRSDYVIRPVELRPCAHTFCGPCIQAHTLREETLAFICPICRRTWDDFNPLNEQDATVQETMGDAYVDAYAERLQRCMSAINDSDKTMADVETPLTVQQQRHFAMRQYLLHCERQDFGQRTLWRAIETVGILFFVMSFMYLCAENIRITNSIVMPMCITAIFVVSLITWEMGRTRRRSLGTQR